MVLLSTRKACRQKILAQSVTSASLNNSDGSSLLIDEAIFWLFLQHTGLLINKFVDVCVARFLWVAQPLAAGRLILSDLECNSLLKFQYKNYW